MRLFVAVNFPADVRQALWQSAEPLRRRDFPVKWVGADQVHVTLKFLGEVPEERLGELSEGLSGAARAARPFVLPLGGFGAFPSAERARVVWCGCGAVPPLELLHHDVEQATAALGFPVEGRPFRPHVTLGRVRDDARRKDLAGMANVLDALSFTSEVTVQTVDLMQSTLGRNGATYTARHSAPLAG